MDLLHGVEAAWRDQHDAIEAQNASFLESLEGLRPKRPSSSPTLDLKPVRETLRYLEARFDARYGGFGRAPKFPHPTDLALLLRAGNETQRRQTFLTLSRMAEGGIFDQLAGGFFRYSVDAQWGIPHFEKMLYDNALLLGVYADAWVLTGDPLYLRTASMIVDWATHEMRSPFGGFYSALDADTDGEEGASYVWTREALKDVLDPEEYALVAPVYGLDRPANFEGSYWHLRIAAPARDPERVETIRRKMLEARQKRSQPGLDDKILAAWNGLMASGLLRAGRVFHHPEWIAAGQAVLTFVRKEMWRDGRLFATWKNGEARHGAYLDDHAFLLAACIESMQADFRVDDLRFAIGLAEALMTRFEDEAGGFFFTSHDHERLIHRSKISHDAAVPAGNGVAAQALLQLSLLTGDPRYAESAEKTLICFSGELEQASAGCASLLLALIEYLMPSSTVVVRGRPTALDDWRKAVEAAPASGVLQLWVPDTISDLPSPLAKPANDHVNAWVCEGVTCLPPIEEPHALSRWFAAHKKGITIPGQTANR